MSICHCSVPVKSLWHTSPKTSDVLSMLEYVCIRIYMKQTTLKSLGGTESHDLSPFNSSVEALGTPHAPSVATLVGRHLKPTSITSGIPRQVSKKMKLVFRSMWEKGGSSRGLQRVQLKNVVIGWRGEVQWLGRGCHAVVARALEAQRALKVQELAHEVEVGWDVGLLHLDNVVRVVHGQVELLHKVCHRHSYRTADPGEAMNEHAALLSAGLIWGGKKDEMISYLCATDLWICNCT